MAERASAAGEIVAQPLAWHGHLAAIALFLLARALALTWRCHWEDRSQLFGGSSKSDPVIFCTWHNRLALSMVVFQQYVQARRPAAGLAAMISASKDGGLLARTLQYFGVESVRGSSSRRGRQALLELTSWLEKGYHVALTPDGPRGPRYVVQDGIIALAQVTGLPIVPVSNHCPWKICTRGWDGFQVPLPFAACTILLGEPMSVPRECSLDERESLRRELENRMKAMTRD